MIHINDLSWDKSVEESLASFKKGDMIKARVRDIDIEKERVNLSVKHLTQDPMKSAGDVAKKGEVVTCVISAVTENGLDVEITGGIPGFIKKNDLAKDRFEQRTDRFAVGEKIDAKVLGTEKGSRKVSLSIKAKEIDEEKQAMKEFGSTDSGASLGDILGAAMQKASEK
jgi:small subunit ribosomal protein S1